MNTIWALFRMCSESDHYSEVRDQKKKAVHCEKFVSSSKGFRKERLSSTCSVVFC